ncbi:MAG: sulfate/molybdate ABC transporter ATP-binding protein [Candidatus Omnitrophota bacterium]
MSGIRVEHLRKSFGDFKAVDDVSFEVKEGELAALLGPSGSGKSTILRIIAGLEKPDTGQIFLTGRDVTHQGASKRNIGFVFQHYALFKHLTVEKNIAFGLEVQKKDAKFIKEKVKELIHLVKMEGYHHHYPSQLSGGQRQRVALARALAPEPRVLLLDEPFGSLDAKVRKNLAHWIRELHKRIEVTGIFVTHDQNEAMEISDKIILINRGKVEQVGTPHDVYEKPQTKFVASFVGNVNVIEAFAEYDAITINGASGAITYKHVENNNLTGDIVLLVRPEEISISKDKGLVNSIPGTINAIHYRGSFYELDLSVGKNIVKSFINKDQFLISQQKEGEEIFVYFGRYQVFEASEGYQKVHAMLRQYGYIE